MSCLASALVASILALVGPVADEADFFSYYLHLALGPVADALLLTILVCSLGGLIYVGFSLILGAVYHERDPREFFSRRFLVQKTKSILKGVFDVITLGGPVILTLVFVSLSMAYINPVSITRLMDDRIVKWDKALTGGYPFVVLNTIAFPDWFINAVDFSYMNLPLILIALALYIFVFHRSVFEEMGAVFCLRLVIMIFSWQVIPVMSPHDRFIDNVYQLPNSSQMEEALKERQPHPLIQNFLSETRERKNRSLDGTMPTSTLPSAHVAWAALIVYYAYRTEKRFLWVLFPIAVLSTIGTILFAQHYFVDIPAGILVTALSIYLVRSLGRI